MSIEVADLVASLRASDEGFSHSMDVAGHAVEGLHKNTDSAIGSIKALGLGLGALSAGFLAGAVKAASDFSVMMLHVQSNTGVSNAEIANMSTGIRQLATQTGAPLDQLSEGLMRIHNSGFSAADSLKILTPAMQSALSTGDDVGKVAQALGVALHEFGLQASQSAVTMNVLHTAAQLGNSTLQEFADGTTKALNLAGGFGVKLVDVAAALATLTQSGQTARQASDGLSSVMSGLVKPTTGAMTAVQNLSRETGINLVADFSAAGLKSRGLINVIDDVKLAVNKMGGETALQRKTLSDYADQLTATGNISDKDFTAKMTKMATSIHDPTAALISLFPNIRAFREMMLFTGSQADSLTKNVSVLGDVMSGKLDPTLVGFANYLKLPSSMMAIVVANVHDLAIALGQVLLPPIATVMQTVVPLVKGFADWAKGNQDLVIGVLAAGAAVGVLTVAAIGLGAAVEVATGPIGLLAAAGAGLYLAWQHNLGGIQGIVANMWSQVKPVLTEMQAAFQAGGVSGLAGKIQSSLAGVDWSGLGKNALSALGGLAGQIGAWIKDTALPVIATSLQVWGAAFVDWVKPYIPRVIQAAEGMAQSVATFIAGAASVIGNQLLAWANAFVAWVVPATVHFLQAWPTMLNSVFDAIEKAAPHIMDRLGHWADVFVNWLRVNDVPRKLGTAILAVNAAIFVFIEETAVTIGQRLAKWGGAFINWVKPHIQPMLNEVGKLKDQFIAWIENPALPAIIAKLKDWGGAFGNWVMTTAWPTLQREVPKLLNNVTSWILNTAAPAIRTQLGHWAGAFWGWVQVAIPPMLKEAGVLLGKLTAWVIGPARQAVQDNLGHWAGAFWGWVQVAVPNLLTESGKLLDKFIGWIYDTARPQIQTQVGHWAGALWGWVQEVWPKLQVELGKLLGTITNWVTHDMADSLKKAATHVGSNMIQGAKDGVTGLAGGLKDTTVGVFKGAWDAVNVFNRAQSPSKLYYDVGTGMLQGTINALLAKRHELNSTMISIATAAADVFSQAMAKTGNAVGQSFWGYFSAGVVNSSTRESAGLEITTNMVQSVLGPAGRDLFAETAGRALSTAITTAHQTAAATSLPSVQSAHAGLARAAVAALAGGITSGAGAIAQATTAAMSQAAQAARASLAEFTAVSAEAAQRLKNLAATGNTSGVVAGHQAQVTSPYDAAGVQASITPPIHNAVSQASGQLQQVIAGSQGALQLTTGISGQMANIVSRLTHWNTLLPDILKGLTDAKTLTDLTTAGQAAKADLVTKEGVARAANNQALLAELQGQQSALSAQQAIEASLIRQVNAAQTLADNAQKTLTADQARLSTLQQQEDAADQALSTAQQNLQTVQETLKTQQDQLNLRMAYDPSHMQQQANVDAMALANALQKQSLDQQIQAAQAAHNTKLVTELNNQKSILDTNYQDQRAVIEAQMQQTTNAYQTQQQHLQDIQQQESINNQLKKAQDQVVAAAKKDVETEAAVKAQQAVVQQATIAANKATQAWKDAIAQRTEEDNAATLRAQKNETNLQNLVTDGYNTQVKQIADLSNKYAALNVVKAGGAATGAATGAAATASSAGAGGPSVNLAQAITDATAKYPKQMHDFGQLFSTNIAAGLAQGLGEDAAIQQAIYNLNQGLQNKFVTDWQMHSPSRVAESYGRNIVAGLVGGIRASQADARAVMGGLLAGPGGGGGGAVPGGNVHVTVHVNGDAVTVSGVDHHGLGKAMGDVAKSFLAAARTTAPPASRLLPGALAPVPGAP